MNKKGLSILLALSMVFSLNTFAFAEEAVVTDEAVVEAVAEDDVEVTQSQDTEAYSQSISALKKKTSFGDGAVTISGAGLDVGSVTGGLAYYHGKKTTGTDLGLYVEDEAGYGVGVKGIKITSNKKATATGEIKFTLKALGNYKTVYGPAGDVTEGEAKSIYKSLKSKFKNAKSEVLTAWVAPSYVTGSVSAEAVKILKNLSKKGAVSMSALRELDWKKLVDYGTSYTAVYIKTKNGSVKKAQLVYLDADYVKGSDHVMRYKVKTKTLKKGRDYTINGTAIKFDNLDTYTGNGEIKAT